MPFSKKKLFLRILVALFLLVIGTAGILYARLSDMETVKGMVLAELERMAGRQVTLDSVEVDFQEEGLGLRLNNLVLLHRAGEPVTFSADSVWIGFRIIPFLTNEVNIRSIEVEGAVIEVVRGPDGRLPFSFPEPDRLVKTGDDPRLPDLFWAGMIRSLDIRDSTLRLVDHAVAENDKPVISEVHHAEVSLSRPLLAAKLVFRLTGYWQDAQPREPDLAVEGEVQLAPDLEDLQAVNYEGELTARRVSTERLQPYWRKVLAFDPQPAHLRVRSTFTGTLGTIVEASGTLEHRLESGGGPPSLMAAAHPAQGALDYTVVWTPGALEIRSAHYKANHYEFQVKGAMTPFPDSNPGLAFQARATPVTAEEIGKVFPFNLVPASQRETLRRTWKDGRVEMESLAYRGSWKDLVEGTPQKPRRLTAALKLDDVEMASADLTLRNVTGRVDYRDGRVELQWDRARVFTLPVEQVEASLTDLFTDTPRLEDGRLELNTPIEDVLQAVKESAAPKPMQNVIKNFKRLSGRSQSHLNFAGPLNDPGLWRWSGETVVEDGVLETEGMASPFTRIQGKVEFEHTPARDEEKEPPPWSLTFTGFSAECRNHRFTGFNADSRIGPGGMKTEVEGRVDLAVLQSEQFIPPGMVPGEFGTFLQAVEVSSGVLQVDYREERFFDSKKPAVLGGTVQVQNVGLEYKNRFRPLREVTGTVTFDPEKIEFETERARYGDSALTIQGSFFNPGRANAELVLKAAAPDFKNRDFSGIPFLQTLDYHGTVQVESILHWTPKSVTLKNTVDLTRAAYVYRDVLVKPQSVANTIEMVALFSDGGGLDFKKLVVRLGGNTVSGTGRLGPGDEPRFQFKLDTKQFKVVPVARYIKPLRGVRGGAVDFEISGKGLVDRPEEATYEGHVRLKEVGMRPEALDVFLRLNGEVFFANQVLKIRKGRVDFEKNRVRVEGKYIAHDRPEWDLEIASERLDLTRPGKDGNARTDQGSTTASGSWVAALTASPVFAKGSGTVLMDIDHLQLPRVRFRPFQGRFEFKEGVVSTDNLKVGRPGRDRFDIEATVRVQENRTPEMSAHLVSTHTTPEGFFDMFGNVFGDCLTGDLERLEANLTAQGDSLDALTRTLNGSFSLRVHNGRIHTGRLLNGTIQFFGYELEPKKAAERRARPFSDYKTIKGDFSVKNGVAFTENFIFEDSKQLVTLVGEFDLKAHTMDTVIGVAPWRLVDSFFKNIPLVGKILTGGDEESVFKNYFKVSGPFDDPKFRPVPITSLEKKVVGMFREILKTPQYIFSGDKKPAEQN